MPVEVDTIALKVFVPIELERWTPFFGQFGGGVKVDSAGLIRPPSIEHTPPSGFCHRKQNEVDPHCSS
jgi:hypothetical protein